MSHDLEFEMLRVPWWLFTLILAISAGVIAISALGSCLMLIDISKHIEHSCPTCEEARP